VEGGKSMILQCKNKKEFNAAVKKYRSDGFNIISFWKGFAELEKGNEIIMINQERSASHDRHHANHFI
jgi:hypothetical protein